MEVVRACIYPKDIQLITGKSERYGRQLLTKIKSHFNKEQHQYITLEEFSEYSGIDLETIKRYIN
ncbi:hypothetical protein [Aegicerativicinus sediminis]|uniref:hypothetical protein n=1 Tax=Aegicerativicinus sediminis TaxID=2893202 RepID=UPI001E64CFFA|nr:hypothetical protein [Aegicerativicinus sediminis]